MREHLKFWGSLLLSGFLMLCSCWGVAYAVVKVTEYVTAKAGLRR